MALSCDPSKNFLNPTKTIIRSGERQLLNPTITMIRSGDHVYRAVAVASQESLSAKHFKKLTDRTNFPENCKLVQEKLVNHVFFSTVSISIRSTDIRLPEVQKAFSKVTASSIELLPRLPDISRSKLDNMENKTEIIQIILNGFKFDGHGNLAIKNLMKKYLLSGVSTQYKDLSKFAHGLDSLLFREKLEEPLKKKAKRRHYSLQDLQSDSIFSAP